MAGLHIGGAANQSNGVGFASTKASGGTGANANAGESKRYPLISACRYAQMSADAPSANAGTTQTWNVNTGDEDLQPYRTTGNDISAIYGVGSLLRTHNLCTDAAFSQAGIAASSIPIHWAKAAAWGGIYTQVCSFWTSRATAVGRNYDYGIHQIGETDSGTPARVLSAQTDITTFYNNLAIDCPSTASMKIILMLLNQQQTTGGSDISGYNAQLLALAAAQPSRYLIVDPGIIPVPSDPHYRSDGYWRLSERIVHAIRQDRYSGISMSLSSGPAPWVQAHGTVATTVAADQNLNVNGAYMGVGEIVGRDTQLLVALSYFAQSTHTLATAAGFTALVPTIDSLYTPSSLHHELTIWQRQVVRASLTTDQAGGKYLPQAAVTVAAPGGGNGATLNLGFIESIGGADPNDPIVGYMTGAPGTNATSYSIATSSTGSNPMTVPAGCTAVAIIGENGATQTLSGLSNTTTGTWTIHRDTVVNPGAGSVGAAVASAAITGTTFGTTTVTHGVAGVGVGAVIVFRPDATKSSAATNSDTSSSGFGAEDVPLAPSEDVPLLIMRPWAPWQIFQLPGDVDPLVLQTAPAVLVEDAWLPITPPAWARAGIPFLPFGDDEPAIPPIVPILVEGEWFLAPAPPGWPRIAPRWPVGDDDLVFSSGPGPDPTPVGYEQHHVSIPGVSPDPEVYGYDLTGA